MEKNKIIEKLTEKCLFVDFLNVDFSSFFLAWFSSLVFVKQNNNNKTKQSWQKSFPKSNIQCKQFNCNNIDQFSSLDILSTVGKYTFDNQLGLGNVSGMTNRPVNVSVVCSLKIDNFVGLSFCFVFILFCFVLFLFCFVLFCFVLFLFCFVLFCFCFVLFCFVLFCFVLFLFCFVLFCFVFVLFCFLWFVFCGLLFGCKQTNKKTQHTKGVSQKTNKTNKNKKQTKQTKTKNKTKTKTKTKTKAKTNKTTQK